MPVIKVNNLHSGYGDKEVLRGINFYIDSPKFIGIVGANGCGKTTLLKVLSGSLKAWQGTVFVQGLEVNKIDPKYRAKSLSYVSQENFCEFSFSCYDIIMMGRLPFLKRFQNEGKLDRDIVETVMELTNTWTFKEKSLNELSGGEKQRVYIARALAQKTNILLLDEPVSHLDIKYQVEILTLLKKLSQKGHLVLTVLHDLNLVAQFCDQVMIMKEGTILSQGVPGQILVPSNIQDAFSIKVDVLNHPSTNIPYVIPV